MSSFLTQCPHCLTSFRVTDRQLDAAEGRVRCGACLGIFSAEANRIIVKPTPDEIAAADARELAEVDDDEDLDARDDAEMEDDVHEESDSDELDDFDDDELEEEVDDEADVEEDDDADGLDADEDAAPAASLDADTDTTDLLGSRDFDIPLGDLNLDIDDEEDADDFEESEEDELDDEEEDLDEEDLDEEDFDESDDTTATEDDEFENDEAEEYDAAKDTRLIDIVYEEYADEEETDAQSADEAEPSEEFEPEFIFEEEEEDELDEEDDVDDEDAFEEQTDVEEILYEEYTFSLTDGTDDATLADEEEEDDDDEEPVLVTAPRYTSPRGSNDKAALRSYLADIEDDEALGPLDDDALVDLDEPVLLEAAPRRSRVAVFALLLANLVLIAVLAWQYADEHVEQLSRSARFASLMPYACRVLDCPEPQRAQPDLFVSEQLLVRSHPRYAQALEVNLVFRNDAPEAQPFPALELGFHDPGNRMVANRLFQPAEYLPPELQTSEMPAQSSIQVTLELVDPGSDAVNYTLAFHAP